jgi:hypothetical protein
LQSGWHYCPYCSQSTQVRRIKRPNTRDFRRSLRAANDAEFSEG